MKPIAFMARCQSVDIKTQYEMGVRCFDLRIRLDDCGFVYIAHGIIEYDITGVKLYQLLRWLDKKGNCYIRVIHEIRNARQAKKSDTVEFRKMCSDFESRFTHTRFWCGRNLYDWNKDYDFGIYPTCEEDYGSVSKHKWLYGWWPWLWARLHNRKIREKGTDKEILLIDYVNIK